MEKDDTEKKKLFFSQVCNSKDNSDNDIKVCSSIYKIKKESIDNSENNEENNNKIKKISDIEDKRTNINPVKDVDVNKNQNSSLENSKDNKIKENNRYIYSKFFEYDEISEKNFSEKPRIINYRQIDDLDEKQDNENENFEELNQQNRMKKINFRRKSSDKKIRLSDFNEENAQTEDKLKNIHKEEIESDDLSKYYLPYKKKLQRSKFFIILFIIGICLSATSATFCILLQLYGNKVIYVSLAVIQFILILSYIFGIKMTLQNKNNILSIIKKKEDPEKINHLKSRKYSLLILYIHIILFNYCYVIMLVNTSFINNIKLSIRGKGYDINQWLEYFSGKNYNEILQMFEKLNIGFLVFSWLNEILLLFIIIYKIILLFEYRLVKSIIQILCIVSLHGGMFQIYLSLSCYKFRDVTSLEGIKLSWVTPGTISNGFIAIGLGLFGFYVFFIEDKSKIFIFQLISVGQILLLIIFTGGLTAIGDKFYNYKHATCNSIFKFISEEYLLKHKLNRCTSKYLFTTDTLNDIQCPKDRIMINWEKTEKIVNKIEQNLYFKDINYNKNKLYFGCINQSCCLQVYFDIKNKFDFLMILCIHQISYFITLLAVSMYIKYKINKDIQEEEIEEKKNILLIGILTIFVIILVIPNIIILPKSSNQSLLNSIDNNEISGALSVIQDDLIEIDKEKIFKYTNESFKLVQKNISDNFKYNIIVNNSNQNEKQYEISYYEYIFESSDIDIIPDNSKLNKINYYDFLTYSFSNSSKRITFKSQSNLINNIFDYFHFIPYHPLKNFILFNIEVYGYFIKAEINNQNRNNISSEFKNITIQKDNIISHFDEKLNISRVSLIKEQLDFSIMNKNELFYIKGNITKEGNYLINIYNNYYNNEPIYSFKSNTDGSFIIGPLYKLIETKAIYYLYIEIKKINIEKVNNNIDSNELYIEDTNYCKYYDFIKISEYGFHSNKYYLINNISIPKYETGSMEIIGTVKKYDENDEDSYLSDVNIILFYDNQINVANERIEFIHNNINPSLFDDIYTGKTVTNKEGEYFLNINKNGQYMIVFIKNDYYLEKHIFTISDIEFRSKLEIKTMQLIEFFNSGKIVTKLEWNNKPPDLDLICRFQVSENLYCYTFFGNKKCVETEFFFDSREPSEISSEIIQINEFSEYIYLFYVRKYFDSSNGFTQNEYKIEGVEMNPKINYTDFDIKYNESLKNIIARILVYSNGYKKPSLKISIPGFINNEKNNTEYKYWVAFCINGKIGINSLKIINEFSDVEPSKNICLSYYK